MPEYFEWQPRKLTLFVELDQHLLAGGECARCQDRSPSEAFLRGRTRAILHMHAAHEGGNEVVAENFVTPATLRVLDVHERWPAEVLDDEPGAFIGAGLARANTTSGRKG
jgi:hypothetical protein